ncbi:hypothetical protein IAQ61_004911 [Plenodomus lingam]|uniref:Predicted protein n=1 Tax=Leptosphaeria maculans (strain JN3 / isolate v23.1.3 / race Av1-4-5-6-7-8) TaxID=985895 RepID=E4ZWV7_LEPMJ|nr:predicted protein [Plenodomus lingam JN3]KAH9874280.1 hypothetical protein IAQ61_004911 [Plenodomus lingam]CBX96083.1 predicted protein [Plenodomus lingam JN3]
MIGRKQQLYRPRRSFRKYYWALLLVSVFLLWHSNILGRPKHAHPEAASKPLAARLSPETFDDILRKESPTNIKLPHTLPKSQPILRVGTPKPLASLNHDVGAHSAESPDTPAAAVAVAGDSTGALKVPADNAAYEDTEDVDQIGKDTGDEIVQHSAHLTHPDDDDSTGTEIEQPVFNSDSQVRIQSEKAKVDDLLNADHPSKEQFASVQEEKDDVEEKDQPQSRGEPRPIMPLEEQPTWTENYEFPTADECQAVKDKAADLPDLFYVPFEVSVKDVVLEGWEDDWISKARYTGPRLKEPKIDFVYTWVNGSQSELKDTMRPYEINSTLNDPEGLWIASHGSNRYREWDELRYSMRSVEKYAGHFTNRIQILVNAFKNEKTDEKSRTTFGKQRPHWLRTDLKKVEVLSQEEFFGPDERKCLPSFDSLTIENQLYNTKSETDRMFALSDDMILGKPHSASDLYSPLFGPTLGFKTNAYNTLQPPTEKDAERFGEKPFLIYTSWLLNRRFGARKRKGQVHFGHSLSRSITKEAITSFPGPAMRSAYQRFRGETGFQLYSWYVVFHYTMERHREALLWSYIMLRSDVDDDGYLDWSERQRIVRDLAEGMGNDSPETFRRRIFYQVGSLLERAGLKPPVVNTDILWTSLDGPIHTQDLDCDAFDLENCLGPGFSMSFSDEEARSPVFSAATIFNRVARESPRCGDCLIKLVLNRRRAGLGPLLPHPVKKAKQRETVIKALMKFQYTVVNPDANFYMVTDAEQAEHVLLKPYIRHHKKTGQICLNDDVVTTDQAELEHLRKVMSALFEGLLPDVSSYEK